MHAKLAQLLMVVDVDMIACVWMWRVCVLCVQCFLSLLLILRPAIQFAFIIFGATSLAMRSILFVNVLFSAIYVYI